MKRLVTVLLPPSYIHHWPILYPPKYDASDTYSRLGGIFRDDLALVGRHWRRLAAEDGLEDDEKLCPGFEDGHKGARLHGPSEGPNEAICPIRTNAASQTQINANATMKPKKARLKT